LEVRPNPDGRGAEIVLIYPDGQITSEVIQGERKLSKRLEELQDSLVRDGWIPQAP
jgi:hypothetical protein